MPQGKCPSCGNTGEVKGTQEYFSNRGWDSSGEFHGGPIKKCVSCGAGIAVNLRPWPLSLKMTLINPSRWSEIESIWKDSR